MTKLIEIMNAHNWPLLINPNHIVAIDPSNGPYGVTIIMSADFHPDTAADGRFIYITKSELARIRPLLASQEQSAGIED